MTFSLNSTYYFDNRIFEVLLNLLLFPRAWVNIPVVSISRWNTESLSDFSMGSQQVSIYAGHKLLKLLTGCRWAHWATYFPQQLFIHIMHLTWICWCLFPFCITRNISGLQEGLFPQRECPSSNVDLALWTQWGSGRRMWPQPVRMSLQCAFWVELGQNEVQWWLSLPHGKEMGEGCAFPTLAFLNVKYGFVVECWNLFPPVR